MADMDQPDSITGFNDSGGRRSGFWAHIAGDEWRKASVRVRLPITALAALALGIYFASLPTVGGIGSAIFLVLVGAWWFGPFLIYLFFIRSKPGSIFFGLLLLLVEA